MSEMDQGTTKNAAAPIGHPGISNTPISTLREASRAWRSSDEQQLSYSARAGLLRWILPEPNMSLHDRIDDLIDEIERLRRRA